MSCKEILNGQPLGPWMAEPEGQNRVNNLQEVKIHISSFSVRIASSDREEVNHEDPLGFVQSKWEITDSHF